MAGCVSPASVLLCVVSCVNWGCLCPDADVGCADGTPEGLSHKAAVVACAGHWYGHVKRARSLCASDWKLCSWEDTSALRNISWEDAMSVEGCYVYNAAQDGGRCHECRDSLRQVRDMINNNKNCYYICYRKWLGIGSLYCSVLHFCGSGQTHEQQRMVTPDQWHGSYSFGHVLGVYVKGLWCLYRTACVSNLFGWVYLLANLTKWFIVRHQNANTCSFSTINAQSFFLYSQPVDAWPMLTTIFSASVYNHLAFLPSTFFWRPMLPVTWTFPL